MDKKAIKAKKFLLKEGFCEGGYLLLEDGVFKSWTSEFPSSDFEFLDMGDALITPGLVDTHIHGRVGSDVMDANEEALAAISKDLPRYGVTSWLATTLTESTKDLEKACAAVAAYREVQEEKVTSRKLSEARIEGIFLEGPFFTEKHKGAQNPAFLCPPDFSKLEAWQEAAKGAIKKVAVAPEYKGAPAFTQQAVNVGIVVGLAHSDATAEEALSCVQSGASEFIHTFNGMSGVHHRCPGVAAAALLTAATTFSELICDGNHVHPLAAKLVMQVKGTEHCVLVSDCLRAGGLPDGPSRLGELDVIVADGQARLVEGGSLAGSTIGLIQAMKNVVDWGLATPEEAINMASTNAALANNLDAICGTIAPGKKGDFLVLNDELELQKTFIAGQEVFSRS